MKCANCKIIIGEGYINTKAIDYLGYSVCKGCYKDLTKELHTGKRTSRRNLNQTLIS